MKTSWAELIIRLGLGALFLKGGIGKLFLGVRVPVDQIITFLPADTSLILLALLELVLGVLLILGLFTKFTAKVTAILLLVVILSGLYLKMYTPLWKDVILLGAAWHLAKVGSNKFAADSFFRK